MSGSAHARLRALLSADDRIEGGKRERSRAPDPRSGGARRARRQSVGPAAVPPASRMEEVLT